MHAIKKKNLHFLPQPWIFILKNINTLRSCDEDKEWSSNLVEMGLCTVTHRSYNLNALLFSILLPFLWSLKVIPLLFHFTCFSQHNLICHFHHILCNVGRFLCCGKRDLAYLKLNVELYSSEIGFCTLM